MSPRGVTHCTHCGAEKRSKFNGERGAEGLSSRGHQRRSHAEAISLLATSPKAIPRGAPKRPRSVHSDRSSSRNSEAGLTPETHRRSRARVAAT